MKNLENAGKSASTLTSYSKDIEQLVKFLEIEGVELVHLIELAHLENFMAGLSDEGYTAKTISRKTNATKTFFRFLHSETHITINVADELKHPKVESKDPRILSKIEYRALRDAARDDVRSYAMVEVLLQAGLTISELSGMKVEHLDIKGDVGSLFVPEFNNKEARYVPLNRAVVEALTKYIETARPKIEGSENVFITKTGRPLLVRNIRSTIDRYFKLAGVEKARVNDLRHTFVAHHLANGVGILHLSKVAGHKRVSTTERYLQYIELEEKGTKTELGVL